MKDNSTVSSLRSYFPSQGFIVPSQDIYLPKIDTIFPQYRFNVRNIVSLLARYVSKYGT